MRNGWTEVALTETAEVVMGQAPPGDTYNMAGVGVPFIQGCAEFGNRTPTPVKWCSATTAKKALPGDVLLSVRAPVGRLNRATEELIIGRGVAAVRGRDGALSDYLAVAIEYRSLDLQAVSAGSTFSAVTKKDVESLRIPLPPIEEQRRIVNALSAFDASLAADQLRMAAIVAARRELLRSAMRDAGTSATRPLSSLADVQSGISWNKEAEMHAGSDGAIGVMGVANVQRDFVHAEDCGWIVRTPQAEARAIQSHTILMIRTNGNAERIGNVHLAPSEAVGYTISSFLTSITPKEPDDAPYILAALQSPQVQQAITDATSGSTGLKNIAVSWVRSMELPWPWASERERVASAIHGVDSALSAYREFARRSSAMRGALISSLVSGAHSIPESYDRFLEEHDPSLFVSETTSTTV